MSPLPESMRFLGRGWWWLHILGGLAIFCYGWYFGQNRAERKYVKLIEGRDPQSKAGSGQP